MTSTSRRVQLVLASTVVALGFGFTAPAFAQTAPVSSASSGPVIPPEVEDTVVTPPPVTVASTIPGEVAPEVLAEEVSNVNNANLAFTGTDAAGLSLLGAGAIALGASLIAIKRRREVNA